MIFEVLQKILESGFDNSYACILSLSTFYRCFMYFPYLLLPWWKIRVIMLFEFYVIVFSILEFAPNYLYFCICFDIVRPLQILKYIPNQCLLLSTWEWKIGLFNFACSKTYIFIIYVFSNIYKSKCYFLFSSLNLDCFISLSFGDHYSNFVFRNRVLLGLFI